MFVYVARHAWAGEYGDPRWPNDSLRPLTGEGIERYREMLQRLTLEVVAPAQIATSPYTRCRQTADLLAEASGAELHELDALQPGSDFDALVDWTNEHHGSDVAWVGHNPDVERFVATLIGTRGANVRFAKGAIAAVRFYGEVEPGAGELCWMATAKLLGV